VGFVKKQKIERVAKARFRRNRSYSNVDTGKLDVICHIEWHGDLRGRTSSSGRGLRSERKSGDRGKRTEATIVTLLTRLKKRGRRLQQEKECGD